MKAVHGAIVLGLGEVKARTILILLTRYEVEQFAGCVILTGQEAPDSIRRIREDLLKRWITGEGIAGRKPYGMQTRMMRRFRVTQQMLERL